MRMSIEEYKKIILNVQNNKNPFRQFQGRINKEWGENFEQQVENICKIYEQNKLAKIEKTPEPMKILKHIENGHFETVFTKSAQPDFKGTIKGGTTVVFDAKFTHADIIRFQALSDYQRETLLFYSELGAISFVLVGFFDGSIYKIDIDKWNNMKKIFGRKYIKRDELDEMNMRAPKKQNVDGDFLGIL